MSSLSSLEKGKKLKKLDESNDEGFETLADLVACAIMDGDEDHIIDLFQKREKVAFVYQCPREASMKLKALMLCLSRTISLEDVDYLKGDKEKLFEEIKQLPKNIADCAFLAAIDNEDAPIHKVMYAARGRTESTDKSHMPQEIENEIKERMLRVEPGFTIDFNFKGMFFSEPGKPLVSTIFDKDEDSAIGFKNTRLNLSGKDAVTEFKSSR